MKRTAIALALASIIPFANAAPRNLMVTDSIFTQVYGSTPSTALAFNIVRAKTNGIVDVLGSPGLTVAPQGGYAGAVDLLPAIQIWKGRYGAKHVYLLASTNDHGLSVPLASYRVAVREFAAGVQAMGLGLVCIKPLWKSTQNAANADGRVLEDYRRVMTEACAEFGGVTVAFAATSTDFVDGIHLNQTGHARFAEWIINVGEFFQSWKRTVPATQVKK